MKFRVILGWMAAAAGSIGFAQVTSTQDAAQAAPSPKLVLTQVQTTTVTPPAKTDAAPAAVDTNAAANAKAAAAAKKKADAKKKEKEEPPIEGIVISRANGGQLGFKMVGNNIVLTFFDAKRKKVAIDVTRGVVRWAQKFKPGNETAVLNPSGGSSLAADKIIPPPHNLKFTLMLFVEGNEKPVETYIVDYHD